jgi:hypothetical protein
MLADVPCLIGCLALAFPRLAVVLVWLFGGGYLARAYESSLWPILGFIFLPLTTLTFAYAMNSLGEPGAMSPLGWLLVGLSVAADLGMVGGGRSGARRWKTERDADAG